MLHAVIMAGGSGTRFWPQSRRAVPKQLLPIAGERTLIQQAEARVASWIPGERVWVVTNRAQAVETARQLPRVPADHVLIEPCGRNTAPCIGLAALRLLSEDPDAVMLVMPADHVIRPDAVFQQSAARAAQIVERDRDALVLFGAPPAYPATGFGYIERGEPLAEAPEGAYRVARFREKPDTAAAREYAGSGRFYWNCGIFVWRAARILESLREWEPEIHERLMALRQAAEAEGWDAAVEREFPRLPSISIDFAVLERAGGVVVLEAPFEWDDVGSWEALPRLLGKDADGNTAAGPFCGLDTKRCIIRTTADHLVATAGLEDCLVVHTPDATLVARKDDPESLRRLVARLEERGYERFL